MAEVEDLKNHSDVDGILIAVKTYILATTMCQFDHACVAWQDFCPETANATLLGVFSQAFLQGTPDACSLPNRIDHEGGFRQIGRRIYEVRTVANYMTIFSRTVHGHEGNCEIVVHVA